MFLDATFRPSNQSDSQEHISLITNSFNDFAFIAKFKHKHKLHKFLALFNVFLVRLAVLHVCIIHETYIFHFNSWLSFQRQCRLLRDKFICQIKLIRLTLNLNASLASFLVSVQFRQSESDEEAGNTKKTRA